MVSLNKRPCEDGDVCVKKAIKEIPQTSTQELRKLRTFINEIITKRKQKN